MFARRLAAPASALAAAAAALASACDAPAPAPAPAPPRARAAFELCPEVACKGADELGARAGGDFGPRPRRVAPGAPGAPGAPAPGAPAPAPPAGHECPDAREALGLHSWHFLHSLAAYYPLRPDAEDARAARGVLEGVARLYPCAHCRAAFAADLAARPPRLGSRAELAAWLCEHHNLVNAALGKPLFPCDAASLDERWRTGRPDCWRGAGGAGGASAAESLGQADS